jgi:hypothetical protein
VGAHSRNTIHQAAAATAWIGDKPPPARSRLAVRALQARQRVALSPSRQPLLMCGVAPQRAIEPQSHCWAGKLGGRSPELSFPAFSLKQRGSLHLANLARKGIPDEAGHVFGEALILLVQWKGGAEEPTSCSTASSFG